jgi:dTMP kinase
VTPIGRSRDGGWFITIEGPEGGGKTSQAARLADAATAAGLRPLVVREPGGTPAGERIRELLLGADPAHPPLAPRTDALLFNAARAQLVADVIEPALQAGRLVISTRFADSTLAYQGYGAGLPLDELRALARFATGGLGPDLTILLDLPVELGLARKVGQEETRFESAFDLAFHRRVRDGFLALSRAGPARFVVLDATLAQDAVESQVLAAVERLVGVRLARR